MLQRFVEEVVTSERHLHLHPAMNFMLQGFVKMGIQVQDTFISMRDAVHKFMLQRFVEEVNIGTDTLISVHNLLHK